MEYLIDTIDDPLFAQATSGVRRTIVLLGLNTYKNIPRNELVVSSDTVVKQKDQIIQRLEDELTTLRSSSRINDELSKETFNFVCLKTIGEAVKVDVFNRRTCWMLLERFYRVLFDSTL